MKVILALIFILLVIQHFTEGAGANLLWLFAFIALLVATVLSAITE